MIFRASYLSNLEPDSFFLSYHVQSFSVSFDWAPKNEAATNSDDRTEKGMFLNDVSKI